MNIRLDKSLVVIETPGHTPACTAHVIMESIFVGDTLFMLDPGSTEQIFQEVMPKYYTSQ